MATITHVVTVAAYTEGNRFLIDGAKHPNLFFARGNTYVFDVSDASVSGHPLKFSTTLNGTHASGSAFTTGVTDSGTAGTSSATVTLVCDGDTPDLLHLYCGSHSGMMGTTASIKTSGVILTAHTTDAHAVDAHAVDAFATNVAIFSNTLAREVPTKIESIVTALKTHTNTELGDIGTYLNTEMDDIETFLNTEMGDITTYINTSLNSIVTELTELAGNIAKEQVEFEAAYDAAFATLQTNLGTYTQDVNSYTQAQIQDLMFTGAISSSNISYDSDGRLSSILSNGKLTWNITYDSDGYLDGFKENVTIGGQIFTKTYTVNVDSGTGEITNIEEV